MGGLLCTEPGDVHELYSMPSYSPDDSLELVGLHVLNLPRPYSAIRRNVSPDVLLNEKMIEIYPYQNLY